MTEELKPCPFCGGDPTEHAIEPHTHAMTLGDFKTPDHEGSHVIECACGAGFVDDTREAAATRWNTRALTAAQPAQAGEIGSEWQACVKLPVTVHVRKQRQGEAHVSTREGITPIKPDDLIMRGVSGEEYPIGRDIFEQTYRLAPTPPAAQATPDVPEVCFGNKATPEPSHAAKMLKADVAYVEQQMAAATPEPEWETTPKDGEQWEASPKEATPEPVGEARCSTCGVTMNEPHHPACGAVTAAIIGLNTMAAQDKEARRRELAEKIRETLRGVFTHPAPGVPEIDYSALIHAAWGKHKYAQGTGGCIAFKRGAEWFRDIALAAHQPAKETR